MSAKECTFYLNMWSYVAVRQERHVWFFWMRIDCLCSFDLHSGWWWREWRSWLWPTCHPQQQQEAEQLGFFTGELLRMLSSVTLRRAPSIPSLRARTYYKHVDWRLAGRQVHVEMRFQKQQQQTYPGGLTGSSPSKRPHGQTVLLQIALVPWNSYTTNIHGTRLQCVRTLNDKFLHVSCVKFLVRYTQRTMTSHPDDRFSKNKSSSVIQ